MHQLSSGHVSKPVCACAARPLPAVLQVQAHLQGGKGLGSVLVPPERNGPS